MPFTPFAPFFASLLASLPVSGYTMINGTGTILTWTAPNDGAQHAVQVYLTLNVTVAQTGGAVTVTYTDPSGGTQTVTELAGGLTTGGKRAFDGFLVQAGSTVTIAQSTAQTAGTAVLNAALIGA